MSQTYNIEFNPIQCTSAVFKELEPQDGFLYFITDTKQIFLGKNNEFIDMCGGLNVFYGIKEIPVDTSGKPANPQVTFNYSHLQGSSQIPKVNDLILNTDGCFYKIETLSNDNIVTKRLTLQGTGSSSVGPTTPGGSTIGGNFGVSVSKSFCKFSSEDSVMNFVFYVDGYQEDLSKNYIKEITITKDAAQNVQSGIKPIFSIQGKYAMGHPLEPIYHTISLAKIKNLLNPNSSEIFYLNAIDAYGVMHSIEFSAQLVNLVIQNPVPSENIFIMKDDKCDYECVIKGNLNSVLEKKIIFSFFNEDQSWNEEPVFEESFELNYSGATINFKESFSTKTLLQGVYNLSVRVEGYLEGETNSIVKSNIIKYKTICVKPGSTTTLFAVNLPENIEQYTDTTMTYIIASSDEGAEYHIDVSVNGVLKTTLIATANNYGSYDGLYFEKKGSHVIDVVVTEQSNLKYTIPITVIEYTGNLPTIDTTSGNLMLYLDPRGKSNNSEDKRIWKDYNGKYTANLSSNMIFSGNSGWLKDQKTGASYLSLVSGSTLTLTEFEPFKNDAKDTGMTIELDFEISGVTDYEASLIECVSYSDALRTEPTVGFKITGKKILFYSKDNNITNPAVSLNLVENKRIRLAFVIEKKGDNDYPAVLSYLNGIISSVKLYTKNSDEFLQYASGTCPLKIDSTHAAIKIYGIKFYSTAFTDRQVLNNYTASLDTLSEKQYKYDSNDVYTDDVGDNVYEKYQEQISYEKVSSNTYNLEIPYMLITGGWQTQAKTNKWAIVEKDPQIQIEIKPDLPTGKKDYRLIDVEVKYPKNKAFEGYEDFSFKNEFENGLSFSENLGQQPINGGCIMYCQGTSSMEYPVKNLRLRFKKEEDYFKVRPDIEPVEIICMKADYMESSGSHNTGGGNLIDSLYLNAGSNFKTPGQEKFKDKKIVTCIKGHPCLIFYRETEEQEYKYIGKYNLNLDKATPEPFGFDHDKNDKEFGYLPVGDLYYDDDGNQAIVDEEGKVNSIHCFEFLDNAVSVCNFIGKTANAQDVNIDPTIGDIQNFLYQKTLHTVDQKDFNDNKTNSPYYEKIGDSYQPAETFDPNKIYYEKKYTYQDTWYKNFKNKEGDIVPGWALGFESRYPEDKIGTHDADMLWPLANWLNELYLLRKTEEENGLVPENKEYHYRYEEVTEYKPGKNYFIREPANNTDGFIYREVYPTEDTFGSFDSGLFIRNLERITYEMESLERFQNEYQCYFNKDFLLAYYVITEALLMADSRVKNMMIATWGKETRDYTDKNGNRATSNNYIFYPIFYDMDTMLGLDNTGKNRFSYYENDQNPSTYNGEEVLWNFVRDTLSLDIDKMYSTLETAGLNINKTSDGSWDAKSILPFFNEGQAYLANEAFYNGDSWYKYINPAKLGYWDYLGNKQINAGEAPYLYAAQGDRGLDREYFVTNRIKFLRGKHTSSDFQLKDRITFRWYYPSTSTTEFLGHQATISAVPPTSSFEFTSLQPCYAGVLLGANGNIVKEYFDGAETHNIICNEATAANGTEAYILGFENLADLGDLSNKYMQKFELNTDNKLRTLKLGNSHKDYYNPYWEGATTIGVGNCKYLETFNLQNCSTFTGTLDFSKCLSIREILLTGSSANSITLPVNGNITELRLPSTITSLSINSHQNLLKENFSLGNYFYGNSCDRIGAENGKYVNDYTRLVSLSVINTPIDTYDIVINSPKLSRYYLEGVDWLIEGTLKEDIVNGVSKQLCIDDQYVPTTDMSYDETKTYYIWNSITKKYDEFKTFYNNLPEEEKTRYNISNYFDLNATSYIKEKIHLIDESIVDGVQIRKINTIPALDSLLSKSVIDNVPRAESLSGTLTLKVPDVTINLFNLYRKYKSTFPRLTIRCEKANDTTIIEPYYQIEFYNALEVDDTVSPYYSVITDGNLSVSELISATGPNGVQMSNPSIANTETIEYEFKNEWIVIGAKEGEKKTYTQEELLNFTPKKNMKFQAKYLTKDRRYAVTFYNHIGIKVEDSNLAANPLLFKYKEKLNRNDIISTDPDLTPAQKETFLYLHRDSTGLKDTERYAFKGWISRTDYEEVRKNSLYSPTIIDPENYQVIRDIDLYAYYQIEDASTVSSNLRYFDINPVNIDIEYRVQNIEKDANSYNITSDSNTYITRKLEAGSFQINLKDKYKKYLKDKVTLPSIYNSNYISIVGDFSNSKIEQIYFLSDNKFKAIGGDSISSTDIGFCNCKNLKKIVFQGSTELLYIKSFSFYSCEFLEILENFPQSIKMIGEQAFYKCSNLILESLPKDLEFLGYRAFGSCSKISLSTIPKGVTFIPSACFNYCTNLTINSFGNNGALNESIDNNVEIIAANSFDGSGTSILDTIYIKNSMKYIGENAFNKPTNSTKSINVIISPNHYILENIGETKEKYFGNRTINFLTSETFEESQSIN